MRHGLAIDYRGLGALAERPAPARTRDVRPRQPPRLTQKDRRLLDLLSAGLGVKEASAAMFWAEGTAKQRLAKIRRKFDMRTTWQLMSWYARLPEQA
jgi:DNA-binding NarL/FixJ family response regulator